MSRRYAAAVRVWCDGDGPVRLRWRHRDFRVTAVLGRWVEAQAWWRSDAASERNVWRVEMVPCGPDTAPTDVRVVELGECGARWVLRSVAD